MRGEPVPVEHRMLRMAVRNGAVTEGSDSNGEKPDRITEPTAAGSAP